MSKNAFGGHTRLDRIDLNVFRRPNDSGEKIMALTVIKQAVNDYLMYGLAERNGTTPAEFWYSCEYLFRVRSTRPETWKHARVMRTTAIDESGKRRQMIKRLSDHELKSMTFDVHYDWANLPWKMDKFLSWLKQERLEIIRSNRQQIQEYMALLRNRYVEYVAPGHQLGFAEMIHDLEEVMVEPTRPEEVAEMVSYHPDFRKPPAQREAMLLKRRRKSELQVLIEKGALIHESAGFGSAEAYGSDSSSRIC